MARAVLMSLIELLGDLSRCVLRRATRGRPECPFLADCVAKLFWASERERMIQGRQSRRNIDSNAHPPRFICFKMQFHRPFSATFATQSARTGLMHCKQAKRIGCLFNHLLAPANQPTRPLDPNRPTS